MVRVTVATAAFVLSCWLAVCSTRCVNTNPPKSSAANSSNSSNKFGIGIYADTPGSPPIATQLQAAARLVGTAVDFASSVNGSNANTAVVGPGWVVLYLCAWRSGHTSCMNASTTHDPESNAALLAAYDLGLRPVVRVGSPGVVRDAADPGSNGTSYTQLASAYAAFASSLPLPPDPSQPLYVHVGNEFNACNEWRCSEPAPAFLSTERMALEVAAFYRDVGAAMSAVRNESGGRILYAHGAIADWQTTPCECSTARALGGGQSGLVFLQAMLQNDPQLYASPQKVDFFTSHPYPFSAAPWGTSKAFDGLTYYRNETRLVRQNQSVVGAPARQLPVVITETGWRTNADPRWPISESQRANWTALAFQQLWLPDSQVLGVCPFLLAGRFWEPDGWPWMNTSTSGSPGLVPLEIYSSIHNLRCEVIGGSYCD